MVVDGIRAGPDTKASCCSRLSQAPQGLLQELQKHALPSDSLECFNLLFTCIWVGAGLSAACNFVGTISLAMFCRTARKSLRRPWGFVSTAV